MVVGSRCAPGVQTPAFFSCGGGAYFGYGPQEYRSSYDYPGFGACLGYAAFPLSTVVRLWLRDLLVISHGLGGFPQRFRAELFYLLLCADHSDRLVHGSNRRHHLGSAFNNFLVPGGSTFGPSL